MIAKAKAKVYDKGKNLEEKSKSTFVKKRTPRKNNMREKKKERLGKVLLLSFSSLKLSFSSLKHIYSRRKLRFSSIMIVQKMILKMRIM